VNALQLFALLGMLGAGLAGCNSASPPPAAQAAPPPVDPATLGVSAGSTGAKLSEADRRTAGEAQYSAVETGQRKSWRGKQGSYGFVEPGAESSRSEGLCREYSHTIYIDGLPQTGKGLACKAASGVWRIVS
jgi:surface antigen